MENYILYVKYGSVVCDLWVDFSPSIPLYVPWISSIKLIDFVSNRCVFIRVFLNAKSNENLRGCEPFLFDRHSFACSQQRFMRTGKRVKSDVVFWMDSYPPMGMIFRYSWTIAILSSFIEVLIQINICAIIKSRTRLFLIINIRDWFSLFVCLFLSLSLMDSLFFKNVWLMKKLLYY